MVSVVLVWTVRCVRVLRCRTLKCVSLSVCAELPATLTFPALPQSCSCPHSHSHVIPTSHPHFPHVVLQQPGSVQGSPLITRQGEGRGGAKKCKRHTLSERAKNGVCRAEQVEARQKRGIMMDGGREGGNWMKKSRRSWRRKMRRRWIEWVTKWHSRMTTPPGSHERRAGRQIGTPLCFYKPQALFECMSVLYVCPFLLQHYWISHFACTDTWKEAIKLDACFLACKVAKELMSETRAPSSNAQFVCLCLCVKKKKNSREK